MPTGRQQPIAPVALRIQCSAAAEGGILRRLGNQASPRRQMLSTCYFHLASGRPTTP